MAQPERFARLLKWYPRAWRQQHGEVLLSTMLDDAEATGHTVPSPADHATAAIFGLGSRLGAGFALWCAILALGISAIAGVLTVWTVGLWTGGWLLSVLVAGVCPLLVAMGVIALLRERGIISEPRALVLVPLVTVALALTVLSHAAWGAGFQEADAGVARSAFADAWSGFALSAWVVGAVTLTLFIDGLLRRARLHRAAALPLSLVAGVVAAPVIGVSLVSAFSSSLAAIALGVTVLTAGRVRRRSGASSSAQAPAPISVRLPKRTSDIARALALVTAAVSAIGVAYAFTGSLWFPGGPDSTIAMGQGITISLLGTIPLLIAVGLVLAARSRVRPAHTWGPVMLLALSFGAVAVAYRTAPEWDDMALGFIAASAFSAAALSWFLAARLPGAPAVRITVGILIGLVAAAFLGIIMMLLYIAFPMPLIALAFAIWTPGTSRQNAATLPVSTIPTPAL